MRAGFAFLVVASLGLLSGVAVAGTTQDEVPAGVAAEQGGRSARAATPDYPRNAAGQTYGAAHQAVSPDDEPDLILVVPVYRSDGRTVVGAFEITPSVLNHDAGHGD